MHNTPTPKRRLALTGAAVAAIATLAGFGSAQAGGQPPEPPSDEVEFEVHADGDPAAETEDCGDVPVEGDFEVVEAPEGGIAAGDEQFEVGCGDPAAASAIECSFGVPAEATSVEIVAATDEEIIEVTPLDEDDLEEAIEVTSGDEITSEVGDDFTFDESQDFETFDCSTSVAAEACSVITPADEVPFPGADVEPAQGDVIEAEGENFEWACGDGEFATVLTESAPIEVEINIDLNTESENLDN